MADKIKEVAEPILHSLGLELFEVQFSGHRRKGHFRVFIDKKEGVTVDNCAEVSRYLRPALDIEDDMPTNYTLEVSSPGLNRPLRRKEDFYRFIGNQVKIETEQSLEDRKVFIGRLLDFNGEILIVSLEGEDERKIPFDLIAKARLEVDVAFGRNKGGSKK